jgi:hypothetical protein
MNEPTPEARRFSDPTSQGNGQHFGDPTADARRFSDQSFGVAADHIAMPEAGPSNYAAMQQHSSYPGQLPGQYQAPPMSHLTHHAAGQDLLYRDVEGQTKWLGPSRCVLCDVGGEYQAQRSN